MEPTTNTIITSVFDSISNINWGSLLAGLGLGSFISSFILFQLQNKREDEVKKREASIAVADLLSEWVKTNYTNERNNIQRWHLQSLYWKTILRLDKRLLDVLLPRLANNENALDTNEIIIKCRQILLGLKEPDLKVTDLNNWKPLNNKK